MSHINSIAGELKLRVPSGRYEVMWKNSSKFGEVLNFKNKYVGVGRHILIHDGNTPKNSDGCLLINQNLIFKDKAQTIEVNDVLRLKKKDTLRDHIKNKLKSYLFGIKSKEGINDVMEHIEMRVENNFKTKTLGKINKQEPPSNVIRIETQDDSDEFIEIILPEEKDKIRNVEEESDWIDLVTNIGLSVITRGRYKPKPKNVTNKAKLKPKSLTRQEVLEIIEKLEKGTSEHIRLVKDKKELDELWERLTKNATKIEERQVPITSKKTGQTTQETLTRYQLDDKTEIVYRTGSGSGGETINVYGKNPAINKTIHIKE